MKWENKGNNKKEKEMKGGENSISKLFRHFVQISFKFQSWTEK